MNKTAAPSNLCLVKACSKFYFWLTFQRESLKATDKYFENQPEPFKGFLLALRGFLLKDPQLTESLKYGMPFYSYKGRMICYLWTHKKLGQPYLGIVDGRLIEDPRLLQEKRSRMKIFLMDMNKNMPLKTIDLLLRKMKKLRDA